MARGVRVVSGEGVRVVSGEGVRVVRVVRVCCW